MSNELLTVDQFGHLNLQGFGADSRDTMDNLTKALGTGEAGEAYGNYGGDMSALRPQSLDGTLKLTLATEKEVKLFKLIGKTPAYNTTEEYNRLVSYGGGSSPFMVDGGLPNEEDSAWERKSAMVKFLGTTRSVTLGATLVKTVSTDNVVATESQHGTTWLLKQIEHQLFYADSNLDALMWDGLFPQIESQEPGHVIDMRGRFFRQADFETGAYMIRTHGYAAPQVMWMNTYDKAALSTMIVGDANTPQATIQRAVLGATSGSLGAPINEYRSASGTFSFEDNLFIQKGRLAPATASSDESPAAPTVNGAPTTPTDATSLFKAADAGAQTYKITARNGKGWSAPVSVTVTVAAGQAISIVLNNSPGARYYEVFRTMTPGGVQIMEAFKVKVTAGATTTILDRNLDLPGTSRALLGNFDTAQSVVFRQLAPLMKLPLARISAAERFMILMFGMPIIFNAKRFVVFKNIGNVPGFEIDGNVMHNALYR